jgi:hypothetical protein
MKSTHLSLAAAALMALTVPAAVTAQPVANSFRTRLTSAAFQPPAPIFKGDGDVTATLGTRTLSISGDYKALASPVTKVRLLTGTAPGVPSGTPMAELKAAGGTAGAVSGQLLLTPAQINLLKAGRIYIQVETEAAPGGALWGWLMPNYPFPGQNVPEKRNWYAQ